MIVFLRSCIILLITLILSGCMNGLLNGTLAGEMANTGMASGGWFNGTLFGGIYSHTIEPITFNREPVQMSGGLERGEGQINHVQATLIASIRLGKNGIGDIAKARGIKNVYFADLERKIILFGIWQEITLHLYGR